MADSIPRTCRIWVELGIDTVAQLVLFPVLQEFCHLRMEIFTYS